MISLRPAFFCKDWVSATPISDDGRFVFETDSQPRPLEYKPISRLAYCAEVDGVGISRQLDTHLRIFGVGKEPILENKKIGIDGAIIDHKLIIRRAPWFCIEEVEKRRARCGRLGDDGGSRAFLLFIEHHRIAEDIAACAVSGLHEIPLSRKRLPTGKHRFAFGLAQDLYRFTESKTVHSSGAYARLVPNRKAVAPRRKIEGSIRRKLLSPLFGSPLR